MVSFRTKGKVIVMVRRDEIKSFREYRIKISWLNKGENKRKSLTRVYISSLGIV